MSNKGYFIKKSKPTDIKEAVWLEEQCLRRQGGYNLDQSNLPASLKWLPKGTVLKLTSNGNAIAVKTARVTEKAEKNATTLKIKGMPFVIFSGENVNTKVRETVLRDE